MRFLTHLRHPVGPCLDHLPHLLAIACAARKQNKQNNCFVLLLMRVLLCACPEPVWVKRTVVSQHGNGQEEEEVEEEVEEEEKQEEEQEEQEQEQEQEREQEQEQEQEQAERLRFFIVVVIIVFLSFVCMYGSLTFDTPAES
jgi:cytochrome c-type biogenesis protein CcmH/NrfG